MGHLVPPSHSLVTRHYICGQCKWDDCARNREQQLRARGSAMPLHEEILPFHNSPRVLALRPSPSRQCRTVTIACFNVDPWYTICNTPRSKKNRLVNIGPLNFYGRNCCTATNISRVALGSASDTCSTSLHAIPASRVNVRCRAIDKTQ